MSFINYATKEIQLKIVYYGCGLCGKTTNLQVIHQMIAENSKGDMTSLVTAKDRTLFFDFLPLYAEAVKGFTTRFQMYTVPGQVRYNMTRKLVLRGVDGVVFVADSQWDKVQENVESFENLKENLALQGDSIDEIPYILQYNKRDLPNVMPENYLEYTLNNREERHPSLTSVAPNGVGVIEALNMIARLVLARFIRNHGGSRKSAEEKQKDLVLV